VVSWLHSLTAYRPNIVICDFVHLWDYANTVIAFNFPAN